MSHLPSSLVHQSADFCNGVSVLSGTVHIWTQKSFRRVPEMKDLSRRVYKYKAQNGHICKQIRARKWVWLGVGLRILKASLYNKKKRNILRDVSGSHSWQRAVISAYICGLIRILTRMPNVALVTAIQHGRIVFDSPDPSKYHVCVLMVRMKLLIQAKKML